MGTRPSLDGAVRTAPSPRARASTPGLAPPRRVAAAPRSRPCRRGRSGTPRHRRPQRRERGRRRVAVGVVRADLDRGEPRPQALEDAPRPGSALPWWETFSTSTGSRSRFARTSDSASAVSSIRKRPMRASATIARSLGSAPACSSGASRAGDSTRNSMPPARSDCPASGTATATRRRRASAAIRRPSGSRTPSRPSSSMPTGIARRTAAAPPSWSAWAWVTTRRSSRRTPARRRRATTPPSGGPVSTSTACAGPGSAWRRPGRRRGT